MRRRTLVLGALVLVLGAGAVAPRSISNDKTTPQKSRLLRPTVQGPHNRPVPILMYHVIGSTPPGAPFPDLYLSRNLFAAQLRWLARWGYHPVTLRSVYLYWQGRRRLPKRPIVLSFDDGYRGHFTIAAPLLKEREWPAVLNLEYAHLVHEDLTAGMIRRLLAYGWELASHTLTHPDLTAVDGATLRREVARSRQLLRRRFGVRVDFFCYPAGRFDGRVIRAVRDAGYLGAMTTQLGLASPKRLFRLARIRIDSGDGPRELAEKLARVGA